MITHHLFRLSGFALMGAGLLIAFGMSLHPDLSDSHAAMHALWSPTHIALILGLLLAIFGVTGMFLRQADRTGWLGLTGFAFLQTGIVLTVVAIVLDAFVFPSIAASASSAPLLDPAGPLLNGPLGLLLLSASVSYILGTLLLGTAALRGDYFPRAATALFMIGGTLIALDPFVPQLVAKSGAILLGLSLLWFGMKQSGQGFSASSPERGSLTP